MNLFYKIKCAIIGHKIHYYIMYYQPSAKIFGIRIGCKRCKKKLITYGEKELLQKLKI